MVTSHSLSILCDGNAELRMWFLLSATLILAFAKSLFSVSCNALCAQKLWRAYIQIPYRMRKVLVAVFLDAAAATLPVTIAAQTVCSIPRGLLTRKPQFALLFFFAHGATMLRALNACTLRMRLDPFSNCKFAFCLRFLANTTSPPEHAFFAFTLGYDLLPLSLCEVCGWFVLFADAATLGHGEQRSRGTVFASLLFKQPSANDCLANHRRHLVHLYGVPCSSNRFTHALRSGSSAFFHCFAPNSSLNLTLKHGPLHILFGVCLSSTAFQSSSSPRNILSSNAGPSGSPFGKTSRSLEVSVNQQVEASPDSGHGHIAGDRAHSSTYLQIDNCRRRSPSLRAVRSHGIRGRQRHLQPLHL
jgi:hypothetical protein